MATSKTGISIEEYLRTSYPDGDCEYVNGEVIPKPMPPFDHGRLQARLVEVFYDFKKQGHCFQTAVEVRSRTQPGHVRLPDFSVYLDEPAEPVPSEPPFVAVEILSPDDRAAYLWEKLREYRTWGVAHIWVIDPATRSMQEFVSQGLVEVVRFSLPEFGLTVTPQDLFEAR